MRTDIIASLPSFLHLPYWLDSSSLSGIGSSENCPVSLFVQVPKIQPRNVDDAAILSLFFLCLLLMHGDFTVDAFFLG
jgi:hypothetical protein